MVLIVPVFIIEQELAALYELIASLDGVPQSQAAVDVLKHEIEMLRRLTDAGRASANDLLDRETAMQWSGLKKDALDAYPSIGSYSAKRWRRGDLPIRNPYDAAEIRQGTEDPCPDPNAENRGTPSPADSRYARLQAALAETSSAA